MRVNKYASWGVLPPPAGVPRPGPQSLRAQVQRAASQNLKGLRAIQVAIARIEPQRDPDPAHPPSLAAWEIVACLGQVRDALCDRTLATPDTVNEQLERAKNSRCAADAVERLIDVDDDDLMLELLDQFRSLDAAPDFEVQRRLRLAELVRFESVLLAALTDDIP